MHWLMSDGNHMPWAFHLTDVINFLQWIGLSKATLGAHGGGEILESVLLFQLFAEHRIFPES